MRGIKGAFGFEQSEPGDGTANFDEHSPGGSEASVLAQLARLLGRIAARQTLCRSADSLLRDGDVGQTLSGGAHHDDADANGRSAITHPGRRSRFFL